MNSRGRVARPHAFLTVTHTLHYDNIPLHILHVGILTSSPISH